MSKKKICTLLLVAAAGGICFALLVLAALGAKGKESVMTSTETEPIYNHFPDLPEASEIQWCSRTSGGIGPSMVRLHIFAFYDHDISGELSSKLQEMTVKNEYEDIELYYAPDEIKGQKWKPVENADFAFQSDVIMTEKLYTTVHVNETGTILYIEAVGD
ncbi:MAG: hypothetical protein K2N44_17995 [Lachnospiraceae bacterium]|nr:hypothetical protein [Lachnospiraceae bacterium]